MTCSFAWPPAGSSGTRGNTATAYRRELQAWATWCHRLGVHPLAAERHHVDLWVRHLTTELQTRTGRPASPATVVRKLSALAGFYDYGVHDAQVLRCSPTPPLFWILQEI